MDKHQTKIIFKGNYDTRQIRALLPNFILTDENQKQNQKIKTTNDFDITDFEIQRLPDNQYEVIVNWVERKKNSR
jgi:hypothetical protein